MSEKPVGSFNYFHPTPAYFHYLCGSPYLNSQIVGDLNGDVAKALQREAKGRIERRFVAPTRGARLAVVLRAVRFRDVVFGLLGAVGVWLVNKGPDALMNAVLDAKPTVLESREEARYAFDKEMADPASGEVETVQGAISALWISKFMADTLPALVSRSCYDDMLEAKDVSADCVKRWTLATGALVEAQRREKTSVVRIVEALERCAVCTSAANAKARTEVPLGIRAGCEPTDLFGWTSEHPFDPRGTMDSAPGFRPTSLLGGGCSETATKARDYQKLIDDLTSRLLRLQMILVKAPSSCVLTLVIQNENSIKWTPLGRPDEHAAMSPWSMTHSAGNANLVLKPQQRELLRQDSLPNERKTLEFTSAWPLPAGAVTIIPPSGPQIKMSLKDGCAREAP